MGKLIILFQFGINCMSLCIFQHREVKTFITGFNGYFNFFSIIIELLLRWLEGSKKTFRSEFQKKKKCNIRSTQYNDFFLSTSKAIIIDLLNNVLLKSV